MYNKQLLDFMKTIFGNEVKCVITPREGKGFVLKTSKDVEFEFSESFPRSAAIIGLIDKTLCDKMTQYSYDEVEFCFSLRLKQL